MLRSCLLLRALSSPANHHCQLLYCTDCVVLHCQPRSAGNLDLHVNVGASQGLHLNLQPLPQSQRLALIPVLLGEFLAAYGRTRKELAGTEHSTLCILHVHCTLYTVCCSWYSEWNLQVLCTVHRAPITVYSTLRTNHCVVWTVQQAPLPGPVPFSLIPFSSVTFSETKKELSSLRADLQHLRKVMDGTALNMTAQRCRERYSTVLYCKTEQCKWGLSAFL